MKIKLLSSFVLVFALIFFYGCKKRITRYPVQMEGLWFGAGFTKNYVLEINKNSKGRMICHGGIGYESDVLEGKIKYKDKSIYIDKTKFWFTAMPTAVITNDSTSAPTEINPGNATYKQYRILAKMSFQNERTVTDIVWFKYKNY